MAFTPGTLNLASTYITTLVTHVSIHSANPGTTGTGESTAARQPVTINVDANGVMTLAAARSFTGGAANGGATWIGLWSASTAGTFRGGFQITTGDTTFNAAGEYNLTAMTVTPS